MKKLKKIVENVFVDQSIGDRRNVAGEGGLIEVLNLNFVCMYSIYAVWIEF